MTGQKLRDIVRGAMAKFRVDRAVPDFSTDEKLAFECPIGLLDVEWGAGGVRRLGFRERDWSGPTKHAKGQDVIAALPIGDEASESLAPSPGLVAVLDELAAYFRGDLAALDRIPVNADGTRFQKQVWTALRTVPAGNTVSYQELAKQAGAPNAVRAVAACNARNPVAIVVPCHRVIGSDGSLTGYGGGLSRKRWLLDHEGACRSLWTPPRSLALFG